MHPLSMTALDAAGLGADAPAHILPEPDFSTGRIGRLRHDCHLHPLMQLPALQALATELHARGGCRFLDPAATQSSAFVHQDHSHHGLAIDEVFGRIDQPGAWVALYNIETVPRYRRFLEQAMASVRERVEREQPAISKVTGFIFISAPPSVTPFHIDRENNFWLQIRGRKTLAVWDHDDASGVPRSAVEQFIVFGDLGGVRLTDALRSRAKERDHGPGEGTYFPSTTPHMTRSGTEWVSPGDGVAISIGINFYTRQTRRHALVHQFNRLVRRAGVSPLPPGISPWRDALKWPLGRAVVRLLQWWHSGYRVPPGGL